MTPKFARDSPHLTLGVRQHAQIVGGLLHLVGRPRLRKTLLKLLECVGAYCTALTAKDHKSYGAVEQRYFRGR